MNKTLIFPSARGLGTLPGAGESTMSASLLDAVNDLEKQTKIYEEPDVCIRGGGLSCSVKATSSSSTHTEYKLHFWFSAF